MKPIANRIYRAIFIVSLISMITMVLTLFLANESLEYTMLKMSPELGDAPIIAPMQGTEPFIWQSASHQIAYIPAGQPHPAHFPSLFNALAQREVAEVYEQDQTFLLNKQTTSHGTLYVARNITAFEQREDKFTALTFILVGLISILSWWLARVSSQKITTPLQRLSQTIQQLPVGPNLPQLKLNYQDQELYDIAQTFNRFLAELTAYMQREKNLLHLASHELRTPIAVIAGAIEIIEARNQLSPADQKTLQRLKRANQDMTDNINTILRLSRYESSHDIHTVHLQSLIQQLLQDMGTVYPIPQRVHFHSHAQPQVEANALLITMLLRNLIQNALQHTTGTITLHLYADHILLQDQGRGLSPQQQARLGQQQAPTTGGLGLYIVTLMCEKLSWRLELKSELDHGTQIELFFLPAQAV